MMYTYRAKHYQDPFWYETKNKKMYDNIFYKIKDHQVKLKIEKRRSELDDNLSYSTTTPDNHRHVYKI